MSTNASVPEAGILAHLVRHRLRLIPKQRVRAFIDVLEPALKHYAETGTDHFPGGYRDLVDGLSYFLSRQLHRRRPALFWKIHKKWVFKQLRRQKFPVIREYNRNGLCFRLDIRHSIPFEHYIGSYGIGLIERMTSLLHPSDRVLDIGANIGLFSLSFARVLRDGLVYSFEPNPAMLDLLGQHVTLNGLADRIRIIPVAVADRDAEMELNVPNQNPGAGSLIPGGVRGKLRGTMVRVKVRAFDALYEEIGSPPIRMVKIDVEGYEPVVVEAMSSMLRAQRPILVAEISPSVYDPRPFLEKLREYGYRSIEEITNEGEIRPLARPPARQTNVICSEGPLAT